MHIGIAMFPTDYSIQPHELAVAAEERGIESMWLPEHSHIPTSRRSPWPGGAELPKTYYDTYDPFISLGAAAVLTKSIKLATGICLVVQRDPIHTAKDVATVDRLSQGRFIFGVGGGWNAEEMEDHGTNFSTRFRLMDERILAMKEIWTKSKPKFSGDFVKFDEMMQWPKPVQKPHPPIIVGGGFPHGAKRALRYGDGWMPVGGRQLDPMEMLPRFRQMAAEAGRDPNSVSFGVFGGPRDAALLKKFAAAGVARVVLQLASEPRDKVLPILDQYAAFARAVRDS
ncbi:MAG TPA: LLM class F420-dependent oxidoreductase [Candidatus Cybelea sp.]|nr:LLM class F420-dependent oxidoreductase [Candidatus Cybelea sp.]